MGMSAIDEMIGEPTSGDEMTKATWLRIVMFSDLHLYNSMSALCKGKDAALVFFVEADDGTTERGLWTLVMQTRQGVSFFDPYGLPPDGDTRWLSPAALQDLGEGRNALHEFFQRCGEHVSWNHTRLQAAGGDVETCGRLSAMRYKLKALDDLEYRMAILRKCKQLRCSPDQLSCISWPHLK